MCCLKVVDFSQIINHNSLNVLKIVARTYLTDYTLLEVVETV